MKQSCTKIKSISEIAAIAKRAKRTGKTVVTTNGAFDLLHIGHVRNLQMAKSAGDILIVGVNSDRSVRTRKDKTRPIVPEVERAEVIAALEAVDYVFIFSTPDPIPWLEKIRPNVHAKGADRTIDQIVELSAVKKHGGKILRVPYIKGHSTSNIIKKIKSLP
ncbi:MAG TPA: adenylyltransferase/cytidyltransferase family protein [Candidatus Paceibacterota bacterium]